MRGSHKFFALFFILPQPSPAEEGTIFLTVGSDAPASSNAGAWELDGTPVVNRYSSEFFILCIQMIHIKIFLSSCPSCLRGDNFFHTLQTLNPA